MDGQILAEPGYGKNITELKRKQKQNSAQQSLGKKDQNLYQRTSLSSIDYVNDPKSHLNLSLSPPSFSVASFTANNANNSSNASIKESDTPLKNPSAQIIPLIQTKPLIQGPMFGLDFNSQQLSNRVRQQSVSHASDVSEFNEKYFQQQQQSVQQQTQNVMSIQTQYLQPSNPINIDVNQMGKS